MWRQSNVAEDMVSPPGPLLDATRELGCGGAEVVLVVVDRAGDVAETARALLDRRRWLHMISTPREIAVVKDDRRSCDNGSDALTVFHFRWKEQLGLGGANAQ